MNRQVDRLENDGQSEHPSSWDARCAHTGCCGRDPGGGEGRSRGGPSVVGEAAGVRLLRLGFLCCQGRGQVGRGSSPQPPHTHRIVIIFTKSKGRWLSCAMNTAATHWKSAAPSMLTVAPMGRMKRLMCLATPFFSSTHFIISGSVAELRGTTDQSAALPGPGQPGPAHCPATPLGPAPPTVPQLGHKLAHQPSRPLLPTSPDLPPQSSALPSSPCPSFPRNRRH